MAVITQFRQEGHWEPATEAATLLRDAITGTLEPIAQEAEDRTVDRDVTLEPIFSVFQDRLPALPASWEAVVDLVRRQHLASLGHYARLGAKTSARVTAEADPHRATSPLASQAISVRFSASSTSTPTHAQSHKRSSSAGIGDCSWVPERLQPCRGRRVGGKGN
ncbi:hypothetical protein [Streptosporangium sp. NPDC087985]|uniref:hypothetical protein n=1 Tax=Streptosporangium sp. NPDC087985 TaxID=3366196 RepID=UPI00382BD279